MVLLATYQCTILSLKLLVYETEPITWTFYHAGGTSTFYYLPENGLFTAQR